MTLTGDALLFQRPYGRELTRGSEPGSNLRLLDQSVYLGKPRFWNTRTPYIMSHSATTELIPLTREPFVAIQQEVVARGAALERKRPLPMTPDSMAWEYRL